MAAESYRKRLRDEGTCSVCLDYFRDPVTLDCGHNFCRTCVDNSWGESPRLAACPQCRERVRAKKLRPNRQLANMVQIAKDLSTLPERDVERAETCGGPLKLFCTDDKGRVCLLCDGSMDPRAYRVLSVAEAVQECKNLITRSLEVLRRDRENILVCKAENEKESQDSLEQMEAEKVKSTAAFGQLHQFLEEQEKHLLAQMEEVEEKIARRRDEYQASLSAEVSSLDGLICELEEKQQLSANELLQDVGSILDRCQKESFEIPVVFPAALKWRVYEFSDINPYLEAIVKQFQDSLVSGLQLQEANVTLDPDTAHPELILSEDGKSVRRGEDCQALPTSPVRFDHWPFVLGHEEFTTGRHCWIVDVGSVGQWAVGVARKSVKRKEKFINTSEKGIWDVGMLDGVCRYFLPPDHPPLFLSQELKKIRVILNCAGGRLAFFDDDTGAQICLYSDASLCREALLPFFWVSGEGHLTICP